MKPGPEVDRIEKLLRFCNDRIAVASGSCNRTHISAVINQVRGAVWCETGKDPGFGIDTLADIAEFLGVKHEIKGDMVEFPDYPDL